MKKKKDYTLLLLLIVLLIAAISSCDPIPKSVKHTCIDPTHQTCDGKCDCDGLGCEESGIEYTRPTKAVQFILARSYQIDVSTIPDSIMVFDGHRFIGTIPMWDKSPLDSLLMIDNE